MSVSSGSIKRQQILNVPQDILVSGNSVWHSGNLAKSEFTPSSHVGLGGSEHAAVTTTVNGFMIASDKVKLNGIADNATKVESSATNGKIKINSVDTTVYTHPTGDGNLHVPANGTTNNAKVLKAGSTAGSISWASVAFSEVTGIITDTQHGDRGGGTLHAAVTQTVNGFMIATDKAKLDAIQANAINQTTADGRYLQLSGGILTSDLKITNTGHSKLILEADSDNDTNEAGEPVVILTQDGGIVGAEIKLVQGGTQDNALMIAPYMDYNTASPVKNYSVFIHDKKIWHEGNFLKSEFTPASHIGTGGSSHAAVTTSANGFMISTDKSKLDGISASAKKVESSTTNGNIKIDGTETIVYTHPTTTGNKHIPSGGVSGQWLKWSTDGTAAWTGIDWSDVASKPTSTITNIDDAVNKRHTQNTDTGTTSTAFKIGGATDVTATPVGLWFGNEATILPYIRWSGTEFQIYKDWNSGTADVWADVKANTFKKSDGTEVSYSGHTHNYSSLTSIPTEFNPPVATSSVLGGVKQGTNISIAADGTISGAYTVATQTTDGLLSLNDKKRIDAMSDGANKTTVSTVNGNILVDGAELTVYTHPTSDGNKHLPSGGATGQWVKWSALGTGTWTGITWSDIGSKPTSSTTNIDDAVTKRHSQNTDTGTTSSTFIINSGAASTVAGGIYFGTGTASYLRWSGTGFEMYSNFSAATPVWAEIKALTFKKSDGTEVSYSGHTHAFSEITGKPSTYTPPIATASVLGGVKIGSNVSVTADGTISVASPYVHPTTDGSLHVPATGTSNDKKVLKAGATAGTFAWGSVDWGELVNKPATFTPPIATSAVLGGVKQGSNVTIDANGVISVAAPYVHPTGDGNKHVPADGGSNLNKVLKATSTAGSPIWGSVDWDELTNKPTTFTPPIATASVLGGVKIGSNVSVTADGTISVAAPYSHPTGDGNSHVPATGTTNSNKVLKAGETANSAAWGSVDWGELTGKPSTFTPPIATALALGGVKIGSNVSVTADGTISVAAPYSHPTGDGNKHVPADSGSNGTKVLKATTTAGSPIWENVDWSELTGKPSTFTPSAHTHSVSDITGLTNTLSDKASLSAANTFSYNGVAIKIQPSTTAVANAVLFQLNNSTGSSLVTMGTNADGETKAKVVINGDLEVTGSTVQKSTQDIQGDMNVTGNLNVTGNAVLGDGVADQTTVKGDLRLEGNFKPIGRYLEVGRMPVFGIADDFQFETSSLTFEDIISHISTFDINGGSIFDAAQTGATRYYRLLVTYASSGTDDSTLRIVQEGTTTEVISFALPAVNLSLDANSGLGSKARTWMSAHFSTVYMGNTTLQAKKNISGNVGIRYIEVIAYDYYA